MNQPISPTPQVSQAKQIAPCPQCNASNARKVEFTWWGGALAPAILKQVKCQNCGTVYNSKTGQSSTNGTILYIFAVILIGFLLGGGCFLIYGWSGGGH